MDGNRAVTAHGANRLLEDDLVRKLQRATGPWIGDDAAALSDLGARSLRDPVVTVDAQHAGVHFPPDLDPAIVARRLLAVNLSDLAAMGAVPRFAFLSLAAPAAYPRSAFLRSLIAAARAQGVELAGGDTSVLEVASFTLTLIGQRRRNCRLLRRSSARAGDVLWVGGSLGEAAIGLELVRRGARMRGRGVNLPVGVVPGHLESRARSAVRRQLAPSAQISLGAWLARRRRPVAAIDLSDGLGRDLGRLCRASRVGATVRASALPLSQGASMLCARLGRDALELAVAGGEDYVLLFALPPKLRPPHLFGCTAIGEILEGDAILLEAASGARPIDHLGWDHLAGGASARRALSSTAP